MPQISHEIIEILTHQPFMCSDVYVAMITENGKIKELTDGCEEIIQRYYSLINSVIGSPKNFASVWYGDLKTNTANNLKCGWCYGINVINPFVVIFRKNVVIDCGVPITSCLIDSYFIDTVASRLFSLLRGDRKPFALNKKFVNKEGIMLELSALASMGNFWREKYGENLWLAVKNGTLLFCGNSRNELELKIDEQKIERPVLFVPPKDKCQVLDLYSIDW